MDKWSFFGGFMAGVGVALLSPFNKRATIVVVGVCIFLVGLTGCSTTGPSIDAATATQFQPGVTTEAQIVAAWGKPTIKQTVHNVSHLIYVHQHTGVSPVAFVPFVGAVVGSVSYQSHTVDVVLIDGKYDSLNEQNVETER